MTRELRVRVVLVGIEGNINLGFIARLVRNFAADELYLVNPQADPQSEEARRYAAKASDVLDHAVVVQSLEEALRGVDVSVCTSARIGQRYDVLRHPVTPWELVDILEKYRSVALVFGRESVGLTRDEITKCDLLLTIPANPDYPVLNLSHAVAIVLYEVWRHFKLCRREVREPADAEAVRRVIELATRIAEKVVEEQRRVHVIAAIKHVVTRSAPSRGEASYLYTFFKRVNKLVERCLGGEAPPND